MTYTFIIIIVILILFLIYSLLFNNKHTSTTTTINQSLLGGKIRKFVVPNDAKLLKTNEGVFSCCYIDKKHNKFYKIYIEPKDNYYYNQKRIEIINNKLISSHFLREFEIMSFIYKTVPKVESPKIYINKSSEIEFNEEIFKKIRSGVHYKHSDLIMKCLVMEYLPYQTLSTFFKNNGFKCSEDERSLISNDMGKDVLIKIYNDVFKKLFILLKHKIVPYDFENASNILFDETKMKCHLIDCTAYNIIDNDENDYSIDDLFLYYVHEVICLQRSRVGRQVFNPLLTHKDKNEIANKTLKGYVKQQTIDRFCNELLDDEERKYQIMKDYVSRCLLGDNDMRHLNEINLLNLYLTNNKSFEQMKVKLNKLCNDNGYNEDCFKSIIKNTAEHAKLFNFLKKNNVKGVELEYVISIATNQEIEKFHEKVLNIIDHYSTSTKQTFYVNPSIPIIGYEKRNSEHCKEIKTNKCLKLTNYTSTVSFRSNYVSYVKDASFLDAFLPNKRKIVETMYLVL